jgi:hypothetical protein
VISLRVLSFLLATISLTATVSLQAVSKLPTLEAKQSLDNLRFVSHDGKFTYFQLRSGSLRFSTNYNVHEVITGNRGNFYGVISTSARKKVTITQHSGFHTSLGVRNLSKIYISKFNSRHVRFIAEGVNPILHIDDQYLSLYRPDKRRISIINSGKFSDKFHIKLKNEADPFFIPQVVMLSPHSVLYTDLSSTGSTVIIHYNSQSNKKKLFWRSRVPQSKIELCRKGGDLFVGRFGRTTSYPGSSIWKLNGKSKTVNEADRIYHSKLNDIGNIICDLKEDRLYFISDITEKDQSERFEAVSIRTKGKKEEVGQKLILSDVNEAGQLINLDGRILLPFNGKIYVLSGGSHSTVNDSLGSQKMNAKDGK